MVEKNADRKISSPDKLAENQSSTMLNDQTIELNFVRNRLETFQATVLRDVQKRISGMIDEVMQELRQHELQSNEFRNFATPQILQQHNNRNHNKSNTWSNRIRTNDSPVNAIPENNRNDTVLNNGRNKNLSVLSKRMANDSSEDVSDNNTSVKEKKSLKKKHYALPDKIFINRESFLTALLEVDHMKTIYHIFYIIFLVFLLNNITYEYLVKGSMSFGLGTFKVGFEKINLVAVVWILQHCFVFSIYYALKMWSNVRYNLTKYKTLQLLWSLTCLITYITSQLIFAYLPTKLCLHWNLQFVSASVLLLETVRLLMKMHSFMRTIASRVINGKLKTEEETVPPINFPNFQKYLYYLFAPTLLYRDEYPRTSTIRWKFALGRFLEVVAVAFLYSYIHERHIKYHFENFGVEELNGASVTIKLFGMLMPAVIIFLSGFYMILHSWLNFTAELLRFGDRMFYRDWWTASNYEGYYRNWNVVVHDWLYEYIYKDFYNHIFKGSKGLSSLTVFFISAVFHEYVLGYALQVIFPVIFVFFGIIGVAMIFLTRYSSKNLATIANQNEVLTNLLAELNTAIKSNITQQFQKPKYLDLFPFKNEEDIIKFEKEITEDSYKEAVMTFKALLNPGGIKKNLSRIFSVEIILNHNMDGVHGKKRLLNYTKIFDAIYDAVSCSTYTKDDFLIDFRQAVKASKNKHFKSLCAQKKVI